MNGHRAPISGIAFHKNRIVTAGYDNQLLSWDHRSKKVSAIANHDHLANQVTFSPDGNYVASASSDHTARVWLANDLKLLAVLGEHDDDVEMVTFSNRGSRLATASRDHKVRVFDRSGCNLNTFEGHDADVISVAWSIDDRYLTSSSDDGTVKVWDVDGRVLYHEYDMNGVETDTLVIAADGTIFAGDDEGKISTIINGHTTITPAHDAGVKRLVLDGQRLVSLSYDRTVKIWDVTRAQSPRQVLASSFPVEVWARSCAFAGNNELVFGTFGSSYATFNLMSQEWDLSEVRHTNGVNAVAMTNGRAVSVGDSGVVHQDGVPTCKMGSLCNFLLPFASHILTGGQTGQVFDAQTGQVVHEHHSPLNCGAVFTAHDGAQKAIIGTYTGEGIVFSFNQSGQLQFEASLQLHDNAVKGVACNESTIFSVCATGEAASFSTLTLSPMRSLPQAHDKIANGCTAIKGAGFASVSRDLKLRIWTPDGDLQEVLSTPHTHSIKCVAASFDGRFVATGSYIGRVAVYDILTDRWVFDQRLTTAGISSLSPSQAGFLAGSYDGNRYDISY